MTRNLREPCPDASSDGRHAEIDPLTRAAAELRRFIELHARTGVSYIRVHSNQGGVTSAKLCLEEPLTSKI